MPVDRSIIPAPVRFWKARLAKDAPFVGVITFCAPPLVDGELLDRSLRPQALISTETTARAILHFGVDDVPIEVHGATLRNMEPASESEWRFLVAHAAWAVAHAPDHPRAQPRKPVDFHTTRLPF